jgi:preprotein translocase subunit SecD
MTTRFLGLVLLALALAAAGCQSRPTHYVEVQVKLEAAGVDPAALPALRAQTILVLEKRFQSAGMEGVLLLEDPAAAGGLRVCFPGKVLPDGMPGSLLNQTKLELCLVDPAAPFAVSREALLAPTQGIVPEGLAVVPYTHQEAAAVGDSGEAFILVRAAPAITDADIQDARPDTSQGKPSVSFTLAEAGAARFGRVTEANIGRQLAIILDGRALSAPVIQSKITESGIITGLESQSEAEDIALCLRSHSLPCKVAILSQKVITRESLAQ